MYETLATVAAGLNAGVGLHAAFAGSPAETKESLNYHYKTRLLTLFLSGLSTTSCYMTYNTEGRGNLWLAACSLSALALPYYMLLMNTPKSLYLPDQPRRPTTTSDQRRVNFADEALAPLVDAFQGAGNPTALMHVKSGLLVSDTTYHSSWRRKYWFSAALTGAAFAATMTLIATNKDSVDIGRGTF